MSQWFFCPTSQGTHVFIYFLICFMSLDSIDFILNYLILQGRGISFTDIQFFYANLIWILIKCLDICILFMKLGLKCTILTADLCNLIYFINIPKIRILSYLHILIFILNWIVISGIPQLILLFKKSVCIYTFRNIFIFFA